MKRQRITQFPIEDIRWQFLSPKGIKELEALKPESRTIAAEVIKVGPKRQVVRMGSVFAKEIHYRFFQCLAKSVVGGSAGKEGQISLALKRRGIRVPEVLGFGSARTFGLLRRDVLLTREVPDSHTVHEVFHRRYPGWPMEKRRQVVEEFARFLRKIHENGVLHTDLHIGNILFLEKAGEERFLLLDTDRVKLRKKGLSWPDRRRNLAQILSNFRILTSRSDQFRFAKAYGFERNPLGRKMMLDVDRSSLRYSFYIWGKRSLQSLGTNRRFAREKRAGFTVFYRRSANSEDLFAALLPDPDRLMATGRILKAGRTVHAAEVEIGGKSFFLKKYNCKGAFYSFRNAFRRSRGVRTWLSTWSFLVRNLPVPRPLICLEERRFGLLGRTYILSEFMEDSGSLAHLWPDLEEVERKDLLCRLDLLLGRMHRFGCVHGDLKWSNILLLGDDKRICLTDLDGSRISGRKNEGLKRKDIHRFLKDLQSKTDERSLQVFLKSWNRHSGIGQIR